MDWIAGHAFAVCFWALTFWGSIKVLDRYNSKNTLGVALGIGVLYTFSFMFPLPGFVMISAWLLLLIRLTMWHYELGLLPAIIAAAATVFVPYFVQPYMLAFVGNSVVRGYGLIYGLPILTLVGYAVIRFKRRGLEPTVRWAGKQVEAVLPEARVAAIGPPVAAPVVAPPTYVPGAPVGDKPSLLT